MMSNNKNLTTSYNEIIEINDDSSQDLFSHTMDDTENQEISPTLPDCFLIASEPKASSTINNKWFKENNPVYKHETLVNYLNSQNKNFLSIPTTKTHREKLLLLQKKRDIGLYVQCDKCNKHRYLKDVKDPLILPKYWFCYMNPDPNFNSCLHKEEKLSPYVEEAIIEGVYNAGSIVWAKMTGYPWWPAIVDDDPDVEQYFWVEAYSDKPIFYNVTFFDSKEVSRAWLKPNKIKRFKENADKFQLNKQHKFYKRIEFGRQMAKEALNFNIYERLQKYSFVARYPKAVNEPVDVPITHSN